MTPRRSMARFQPFQQFFKTEAAGGVILLLCAFAAMVAANSPWAESYERMWTIPIAIDVVNRSFSLTLHQWINDGLMTIFFLLVGLEIKRELVAGELAELRHATLAITGAIGGMIVPAILYVAFNYGGPAIRGSAIPMATDVAFALGALSLLVPRAATGMKVFLAALAIVDDMGAILVIALFYTHAIAWGSSVLAALVFLVLVALNGLRVRRLGPYLVLGVCLWFFVYESGLHATIAGVLLALAIPTRTRINARQFSEGARQVLDEFDRTETGDYVVLTSKGQQEAIEVLERATESVTAPLLRLERRLHGVSAIVVMPLFALSNAGVHLSTSGFDGGVAAGVALGLALGKPLGIAAATHSAVTMRLAARPHGVRWAGLHACAWLGGIGFTMSLFIATLAFERTPLLPSAKLGLLVGSVVASIGAALVLRWTVERPPESP